MVNIGKMSCPQVIVCLFSGRGVAGVLAVLIVWLAFGADAQGLRRDFWNQLPGSTISALTSHAAYPENPDGFEIVGGFEYGPDTGDNYGGRFSGFIIPPETGDYIFFLSGDDSCELRLGPAGTEIVEDTLIAFIDGWTGFRQWDKFPSQQSSAIFLEAGRVYPVELLHKEGTGGDHVSVGWKRPGGLDERPISGTYMRSSLESVAPPTLVGDLEPITLAEGSVLEVSIEAVGGVPLSYQWFFNGAGLVEFREATLRLPEVQAEWDGAEIYCRISNSFGAVETSKVRFTVVSETQPPVLVSSNPAPGSRPGGVEFIEVLFSEPVDGVVGDSLTVNGEPAIEVDGLGAGPYRFVLGALEPGSHSVALGVQGKIVDRAITPNTFSPVTWEFELGDSPVGSGIKISEFQAINPDGYADRAGNPRDWIELWNSGDAPINLSGWSLSDDPKEPGQWILPGKVLQPGERWVVFASGLDLTGSESHTNFKLGAGGEYLALYGPGVPRPKVFQVGQGGRYPDQRSGFSYGLVNDGDTWGYLTAPSPGGPNSGSFLTTVVPEPEFSVERGLFRHSFDLVLSVQRNTDDGVRIRYTTDGSEPTTRRGLVYTSPVAINKTMTVRAIAYKPDSLPSRVVTHSYIEARNQALQSIPVIFISTDRTNLRGPTGIMETSPRNTVNRGIAWERPCSTEWIFPDSGDSMQVNCGLRIQGGNYVRERYHPNGGLPFSKYSFRLYFRSDYGSGKFRHRLFPGTAVDEFDVISLRAGMNDHTRPYIIDEYVRSLHSDMGHVASHGTFAHLFINGEYQGYYNPTERIDDRFLDSYFGDEFDWDIVAQFGEIREGDRVAWNRMFAATQRDQTPIENFTETATLLDIDNFIDYLLLNIYAGTGDWPHNNWRAFRQRSPDSLWKFLVWDAEWAFGNLGRPISANILTDELRRDAEITDIFQSLKESPEFRLRFADRVQKHMYDGGVLTRTPLRNRLNELAGMMNPVISGLQAELPYSWTATRWGIVLNQLKAEGLLAAIPAPDISPAGAAVAPGEFITIEAGEGEDIFYTTDGTDPRLSPLAEVRSHVLFEESSPRKAWVPVDNRHGDDWKGQVESFNDSGWTRVNGGIGYDLQQTYRPYFTLDTQGTMYQKNPVCYVRIPFEFQSAQLDEFERLVLELRYDDGFTAWLNGVRVAGDHMAVNPAWNDGSILSNPDNDAQQLAAFDISNHLSALREGQNILAIQSANISVSSSDFLISARLVLSRRSDNESRLNPSARQYTTPIPVIGSFNLNVRARNGNDWSALRSRTYQVNQPLHPVRISEIMYHSPVDPELEWIEISNFGADTVNLNSWRFEGINFRFGFGAQLESGDSALIVNSGQSDQFSDAFPSVSIWGEFRGELSNAGETIRLFDADNRLVDQVRYDDSGAWPENADGGGMSLELSRPSAPAGTASAWWTSTLPGGSPGQFRPHAGVPTSVVLSELMAYDSVAAGEQGQSSDWAELVNLSSGAVDLSGWRLSDSDGSANLFQFPAGLMLEPGGRLVVGLGGIPDHPGVIHVAGFSLDRDGEALYLFNRSGDRVDGVEFGFQAEGYTLSRFGSVWDLGIPSPGAENNPAETGDLSSLVFNEWLAIPTPETDVWIELTNIEATRPLNLTGLQFIHEQWASQIGVPTFLGAGEFAVFRLTGSLRPGELPATSIGLREFLEVADSSGEIIARLGNTSDEPGGVFGLFPDGTGSRRSTGTLSTPGAANVDPGESPVIIHEFMALAGIQPDVLPRGWLEVMNTSENAFDLSGYRVEDADRDLSWQFPDNARISAGGFLTLALGRNQNSGDNPPQGMDFITPLEFGREGGHIRLVDTDGFIFDEWVYGPQIFGMSIGLDPRGDVSLMAVPTPGSQNAGVAELGNVTHIRINEWRSSHPSQRDWFELYNSGELPVSLEDLTIADNPYVRAGTSHSFPVGSHIAGASMIRLYAENSGTRLAWHIPFQLDADGELLRLYDRRLSVIDQVALQPMASEETVGRFPDGGSDIVRVLPTPGFANLLELPSVLSDLDGDGMADWWELEMDLDPLYPLDASLDLDDDGLTNLQEFRRLLNPRIFDESIQVGIRSDEGGNGNMTVSFTGRIGGIYVIESTSELSSGGLADWNTYLEIPELQSGGRQEVNIVPTRNTEFFRVRLVSP